MQLRGLAARTQESYLGEVRRPRLPLPAHITASTCASSSTSNPGHAVRRKRTQKMNRISTIMALKKMKSKMFWFALAKIDQDGKGHVLQSVKRRADAICA